MDRKKYIRDLIIKSKNGAFTKLKSLDLVNDVVALTSFLDDYYDNISWSQRFWHIINEKYEIVECHHCGKKPARYRKSRKYITCSELCEKNYRIQNYNNTCDIKYGCNPSKLDSHKNKVKETCLKNFGKESYLLTEEYKQIYEENLQRILSRKKKRFDQLIIEKIGNDYTLLNRGDYLDILHKKCNSSFNIHRTTLSYRLKHSHEICTICNPINKSYFETEVYEYIKSVFNGSILRNDKNVLGGKELDIYIPSLKLAFECNGDLFHANPRIYDQNNKIFYKNASEIWDKDGKKILLCARKGIELIYIWELDWNENNKMCKYFIKRIIKFVNEIYII